MKPKKMNYLLKKYNLVLILLHGSRATGKIHPESDVDIAVMQASRQSKLDLLGLYSEMAKTFGSDKIDIVNLNSANPLLAYTVARKSALLAGKKSDYDEFLRLAFHKYSDYKPYLRKEAEFVKERVNAYATG